MASPQVTLHQFPCNQCGADLQFQAGTRTLQCGYCGHSEQIPRPDRSPREFDLHSTIAQLPRKHPETFSHSTQCANCSAIFNLPAGINSDDCPFCGSPVVLSNEHIDRIPPEAILPFRVSSEKAESLFRHWLKNLWFAPGALAKLSRRERPVHGVYVPWWTYDCIADVRYEGERGSYYQVPRTVTRVINGRRVSQRIMVQKVRWRPVAGSLSRDFDDTLALASRSLPREITESIRPFDLENLEPFSESFVSGFQTQMYEVGVEEGLQAAKIEMEIVLENDIRYDIGGDVQRIRQMRVDYRKVTCKHVLLPVWMAAFRYQGKTFQFLINGRTGETQGKRPYSKLKVTLAAVAVITVLIVFLLVANNNGDLLRGQY